MSTNLSRRKILQAASGLAVATGITALGQTLQKRPTISGYKYRGRSMAPGDIASDANFASQDEPVYFVTDSGPDANSMQVFRSFDELTASHRGTIAFDALNRAQLRMRADQAMRDQVTPSDIERVRSQQDILDSARHADSAFDTSGGRDSAALSILPRPYGGWLYEHDDFGGRSTNLSIAMPDASWVAFDNLASSAKFSGLAVFSDLSWYRGSKLVLLYFSVTSIPAFSAFQTVHGVSWNDLISSWTCVSY